MSLIEGDGGTNAGDKTSAGNSQGSGNTAGTGESNGQGGAPNGTEVTTRDWYYDDNIKGSGDRPEWLKEKYKTATDQAKAYNDLEKKLGAFKGAPESYDLSLEGYPDIKFSDADPLLKDFLESAKKNGVSQEYVSEMLVTYAKALTANIPNKAEEMKKIGPNAEQDLKILSQWASNHLSQDEFKAFKNMVTSEAAYRVFDKLRNVASNSDIQAAKPNVNVETVDQVKALISDPRYDKEPAFRDDVRRRMSIAMANQKAK